MPKPRRATRPAYLASLAVAVTLAMTGCSAWHKTPEQKVAHALQAWRDAVPGHVADPQRAARVQRAVDGMGTELAAFQQLLHEARDGLHAANGRPDVPRAELDALVAGYDTRRREVRARVLQHHAEMIAATTADEWHALAPHERKALAEALN